MKKTKVKKIKGVPEYNFGTWMTNGLKKLGGDNGLIGGVGKTSSALGVGSQVIGGALGIQQTGAAKFGNAIGDITSNFGPAGQIAGGIIKTLSNTMGGKGSVNQDTGEVTKPTGWMGALFGRSKHDLYTEANMIKNSATASKLTEGMRADYFNNAQNAPILAADGGVIPNTLAYLDDGELGKTPDGTIFEVPEEGKPTDSNLVNIPKGSKILSDKVKMKGTNKTYAEVGKHLMKNKKRIGKYAEGTEQANQMMFDKLINMQELQKQQEEAVKMSKGGCIPKYAVGTDGEDEQPEGDGPTISDYMSRLFWGKQGNPQTGQGKDVQPPTFNELMTKLRKSKYTIDVANGIPVSSPQEIRFGFSPEEFEHLFWGEYGNPQTRLLKTDAPAVTTQYPVTENKVDFVQKSHVTPETSTTKPEEPSTETIYRVETDSDKRAGDDKGGGRSTGTGKGKGGTDKPKAPEVPTAVTENVTASEKARASMTSPLKPRAITNPLNTKYSLTNKALDINKIIDNIPKTVKTAKQYYKDNLQPEQNTKNNNFNFADLAQLAPSIAGMFPGKAERAVPYTTNAVYGPTQYNINPQLRAYDDSFAVANYNTRNSYPSTGMSLAAGLQNAVNLNNAYAQAYGTKNNAENQLGFQNANIANSTNQYNAQARHLAAVENAQNGAARRNIIRSAERDLATSIAGMRKDDRGFTMNQAMWAAMSPYMQYGMTNANYNNMNQYMTKAIR